MTGLHEDELRDDERRRLLEARVNIDGDVCRFEIGSYADDPDGLSGCPDGRIALLLVVAATGEPFGKLTVNLPEHELPARGFFVATWAEHALVANALRGSPLFDTNHERLLLKTGHGIVTAEIWTLKEV